MRVIKHVCFLTAISVIFAFCLLACANERQENSSLDTNQNTRISNSNTNQFDAAEFERNRELWNSRNIQNYKMIVEARFFANVANQVLIEVENRRAISIKPTSETDKGNAELYKPFDTVEKIFEVIERANKAKAEKLNVEYDKTLGYPSQIAIDERFNMADDQLSLKIRNLEITK